MNPKKLLLTLTAVAALAAVLLPASSEAGSYRSRIEGTCAYCRGPVYSYYRPIGYDRYGRSSYSWVTSHHTACRTNVNRSRTYYGRPQPSVSLNFGFTTMPSFYNSRYGYRGYGYRSHGHRYHGRGGYCR